MKRIKLLFLIIGILVLPNAYAGWGDLGWGDCEGGWDDCEAVPEEKQGGGGGGGFSSPAEQIASVTTAMNQQLCLQSVGFDWFEDTCYECDGKIAKRNEQKVCLSCIEGYTLIGEECKSINPSQESNIIKKAREISLIDKYLDKFFPTNPLLGLLTIISALGIGIYGFINREVLIKRFKSGRGN